MSLDELADAVGHRFADPALLERAMAHRSWCAEHHNAPSNERLEFLGDAVLGMVVADLAYRRFTQLPEGQLTNLRKAVVNATALAEVARSLSLGHHIKLGRGEDVGGGRDKPSILSDALEAVIGAVYLDAGTDAAAEVVTALIADRLAEAVNQLDALDFKSRLQELAAASGLDAPEYSVRSEGPDHAQRFFATVTVSGRELGAGEGTSKKNAERVAAEAACRVLERDTATGRTDAGGSAAGGTSAGGTSARRGPAGGASRGEAPGGVRGAGRPRAVTD